eukprot:CAMPEP_0176494052 /NCGR_PEP_ID=MMETSP0200_2-20121128/9878_1 /TAXON_ID=947934 /ORGANISM="Chaetoceros sp., Strain GSL56" /LENGTH=338 /DNA_ID=CAMNT_0017891759 /DNA_START=105 /DNA_END=1121 /DNA_ORIENTATION=-
MDQQEQEEEYYYYVAGQESCIFNCPYVEDQVKTEVHIEQGAAAAAAAAVGERPGATAIGGVGGEYYEEDQDDRYYDQQYSYYPDHRRPTRDAFDDLSLYYDHQQQHYLSTMTAVGAETEELVQGEEFRLITSSAEKQQHDGEESASSSIIRNGPRPPFVAQEEHEVRGASHAAYPSSSSSCSGLVGMTSLHASSTTNKSNSTTRTREKHSSPEDINFLLKWRYLQSVSVQQQSARFMSSIMGYPLSTVPEQEELVEVGTSTTNSASSSGSFKPASNSQHHSRDSVVEGGLVAPRIIRSFPNLASSHDTTSLLDYDLSTSQDDETNINNDASLSFQEDD